MADYFQKMFDGQYIEATTHTAEFPEDPEAAWVELIQFAYTRHFSGRRNGLKALNESKSGVELTDIPQCFTIIKLACLAQKYCITDLHNRAVDSLVPYMVQDAAAAPFFSWQAYQEFYRYVYSHSGEGSALRRLFGMYFGFLMFCPEDVCTSTYKSEQMLSLATELPGLMSDFFNNVLQNRDAAAAQPSPWNMDPCAFHVHSPGVADCPRAFGGKSSFKFPSLETEVHYKLQDEYFRKAVDRASAAEIGRFFNSTIRIQDVVSAVKNLVNDGANVRWMEEGHEVCLVTPDNFEASEGKEEVMVEEEEE